MFCFTAGKITCYIDGDAQFLPSGGDYGFSNIPALVCDLIIFSGNIHPDPTTGTATFSDIYGFGGFAAGSLTPLLISVGDPAPGSTVFGEVVSDPTLCANLVSSIVDLVSLYDLSGVEIDWETIEITDTVKAEFITVYSFY